MCVAARRRWRWTSRGIEVENDEDRRERGSLTSSRDFPPRSHRCTLHVCARAHYACLTPCWRPVRRRVRPLTTSCMCDCNFTPHAIIPSSSRASIDRHRYHSLSLVISPSRFCAFCFHLSLSLLLSPLVSRYFLSRISVLSFASSNAFFRVYLRSRGWLYLVDLFARKNNFC